MMCLLHTGIDALTRELERDSTELLDRHGYELAQRIDQ
jgi:hypothetical protein